MPFDRHRRALARFRVRAQGDAALEFSRRLTRASSNAAGETAMARREAGRRVETPMERTDGRRWTDHSMR